MKTQKYIRKPFIVDAVQVTEENIEDVAKWADGEVREDDRGRYIYVHVTRPQIKRHSQAFVGDWVFHGVTGWKVYSDKAFQEGFEKKNSEIPQTLVGDSVQPTNGAVFPANVAGYLQS